MTPEQYRRYRRIRDFDNGRFDTPPEEDRADLEANAADLERDTKWLWSTR